MRKFVLLGTSGATLFGGVSCSAEQLNAMVGVVNAVAQAVNGEDDDISFWDWLESELRD